NDPLADRAATDEAYKAMIEQTPKTSKKVDPWGGLRAAPASELKSRTYEIEVIPKMRNPACLERRAPPYSIPDAIRAGLGGWGMVRTRVFSSNKQIKHPDNHSSHWSSAPSAKLVCNLFLERALRGFSCLGLPFTGTTVGNLENNGTTR